MSHETEGNSIVTETIKPVEGIKLHDVIRQITASCFIFTLVIQAGINMSYSTVLLPQLNMTTEDIKLTKQDESWIASLVTLSLPLGSLCVGPLIDKWGRRRICMLASVPFIIAWLLIGFATNVIYLYVGRILSGLAAGLTTVCLIYVGELAHPLWRPALLALNSVFVSLGILITCSLGVLLSWRSLAFVYSFLAVVSLVLQMPLPESPHWLLITGKDPYKSIHWLYKNPKICRSQLTQLQEYHRDMAPAFFTFLSIPLLDPAVYRPTLLLCFLFVFQQLSGAYIIIFYTVDIFKKISLDHESISLVAVGVLRFVMSLVSVVLATRFGRRSLLIMSGVGMCTCSLAASLCVHISILSSLLFLLAYVCFGAIGFLVIPWTLIAEVLPVRVRGSISGVVITLAYLCMFSVIKLFPILLDTIDIQVILSLFALNSFFALLLVFCYLPETRGKNFTEIENYFTSL